MPRRSDSTTMQRLLHRAHADQELVDLLLQVGRLLRQRSGRRQDGAGGPTGFAGSLVDAVDVDRDLARRRGLLLDRAGDRGVDFADLGDDLADLADGAGRGLARALNAADLLL